MEAGNNIADLAGCFDLSNGIYVNRVAGAGTAGPAVGAVYAMSNGEGQVDGIVQGPNAVVAYAQAADGTLTHIGTYPTGGNGGDFDGGEGLDPLISAYAITKTDDNRFVLAVNAGSNSVTAMQVNDDFSLTVTDTESTVDFGPNSIAYYASNAPGVNGLVYVSNISRPEFLAQGEPAQQGSVIGYRLLDDGSLEPIANSIRNLANRPSAIQFSPDGNYVVVASINSGSSALASGSEDEIVLYRVNSDGTLSANQLDGATSTLRGNAAGRNLPSAIGFQIVGDNYVVVTEAREFRPDGTPPIFPALQDGSVSTWQIMPNGTFRPINLDVASGTNNTGRTACWLDFSDENTFFVSNAIEAGLASYSFNDGQIQLLDQVAAQGTGATGNTTDPAAAFGTTEGWIDLWISDDGRYLYQAYGLTGTVGVFEINGAELTLIQEVTGDLPQNNIQGIVSVGQPVNNGGTAGTALDGGQISTQSGATSITVCSGDNVSNIVQLTNNASNDAGVQYGYILVYDDGRIGGFMPTGLIELEGSPTLNASIYGIAFTGNITFTPWDNISNTRLTDGEYALSSNAVSLSVQNGGCTSDIDSGLTSGIAQSRNANNSEGLMYINSRGEVTAERSILFEEQVSVYPNPATSEVFVQINNLSSSTIEEDVEVSVYDLLGRKLVGQEIDGNVNQTIQLNISDLQNGLYFIDINSKEGVRFIKQPLMIEKLY